MISKNHFGSYLIHKTVDVTFSFVIKIFLLRNTKKLNSNYGMIKKLMHSPKPKLKLFLTYCLYAHKNGNIKQQNIRE